MTDQGTNEIREKVKPYPMKLNLVGGKIIKGEILKLTEVGFLSDLKGEFVEVGDAYKADFTIPVFSKHITIDIIIIKTYDHYMSKDNVVRIVECHYEFIGDDIKQEINRFLEAIQQT
ncbi:MAG: hypothetical protein HOO06_09330 [Bdellovibrionaceae bacterium]|nr:hypothetical protein [Pseudobdellovibrionaceae bacterium]